MKAVNELDYTLQHLEAHGIYMGQIAVEIVRSYNYIKAQKTQKKALLQSGKLLQQIQTRYAKYLTDMPPYKKEYDSPVPKHEVNEKNRLTFVKLSEVDAADLLNQNKELALENNFLLHQLGKKISHIEARQEAQDRYLAKRDANGDPKREEEILQQLKEETDKLINQLNPQDSIEANEDNTMNDSNT